MIIRSLIVLSLFSFFSITNTLAQSTCVDTDPVGDGWGWDGSQSCRVGSGSSNDSANNSSSSTCVDTDPVGDGWGWDGSQSCRVGSGSSNDSANNSSSSTCVDTDPIGDGWGWDGSQSCRVGSGSSNDSANNSSSSTCVDTDPIGDGWGWDGASSCAVSSNSNIGNEPDNMESIPQAFTASYTGFPDTDEDNVADRYDIDFNGGLDTNRNGVDDIYETAVRGGIDHNNDGIEDFAHEGLASGGGSSITVKSDGPDTANVKQLFADAWGSSEDILDQDCNGGHSGFGSHIQEAYDPLIERNVFRFVIHAREDNDCAIEDSTNRQRVQIVSHGSSTEVLATEENDWMTYTFGFFIPIDYRVDNIFNWFFQLRFFANPGHAPFNLGAREVWIDGVLVPSLYAVYSPDGVERRPLLIDSFDNYRGKWIDTFVRTRSSDNGGILQVLLHDRFTGELLAEIFEQDIDMWRSNSAGQKASYGFYRGKDPATTLKDEEYFIDEICIAKGVGRCIR